MATTTVVLRLELGEDAPEDFAMHAMMKARETDPEIDASVPVTVVSSNPVLGERGWSDVAYQIGEPPEAPAPAPVRRPHRATKKG